MASRAERGECSALHDGVVGARRAGALLFPSASALRFQTKCGAETYCRFESLRATLVTPSASFHFARPSINRGTVSWMFSLNDFLYRTYVN